MGMAPSSMSFSAAYVATLPAPLTATRLPCSTASLKLVRCAGVVYSGSLAAYVATLPAHLPATCLPCCSGWREWGVPFCRHHSLLFPLPYHSIMVLLVVCSSGGHAVQEIRKRERKAGCRCHWRNAPALRCGLRKWLSVDRGAAMVRCSRGPTLKLSSLSFSISSTKYTRP